MGYYESGVMTADQCGPMGDAFVDHCVQLVGFDRQQNYWIDRNSWGTEWGEEGNIYLQMDRIPVDLQMKQQFQPLPMHLQRSIDQPCWNAPWAAHHSVFELLAAPLNVCTILFFMMFVIVPVADRLLLQFQ